jgi:hypothetical protein
MNTIETSEIDTGTNGRTVQAERKPLTIKRGPEDGRLMPMLTLAGTGAFSHRPAMESVCVSPDGTLRVTCGRTAVRVPMAHDGGEDCIGMGKARLVHRDAWKAIESAKPMKRGESVELEFAPDMGSVTVASKTGKATFEAELEDGQYPRVDAVLDSAMTGRAGTRAVVVRLNVKFLAAIAAAIGGEEPDTVELTLHADKEGYVKDPIVVTRTVKSSGAQPIGALMPIQWER